LPATTREFPLASRVAQPVLLKKTGWLQLDPRSSNGETASSSWRPHPLSASTLSLPPAAAAHLAEGEALPRPPVLMRRPLHGIPGQVRLDGLADGLADWVEEQKHSVDNLRVGQTETTRGRVERQGNKRVGLRGRFRPRERNVWV